MNSPEVKFKYHAVEDKIMKDVIDQYKHSMDNHGQTAKENLYLKKLRLHHPWFRHMSF